MDFVVFKDAVKRKFEEMFESNIPLFLTDVDKDEMYGLYLDAYPAGKNRIYRQRREYDCSACRHFIKSVGNVVGVKDEKMISIWDVDTGDETFNAVAKKLSDFVKSANIMDAFIPSMRTIGIDYNFEGNAVKWNHFSVSVPANRIQNKDRIPALMGEIRDSQHVYERSLKEISMDAIDTVLELISQNSLYRGQEWESALRKIRKEKMEYDALRTEKDKGLFTWEHARKGNTVVLRMRNHSIGTLLTNISEGTDLDIAVRKYEEIVAPANYKRPKAIYTKRMLEDAKKEIQELGYMESLQRRFATLDDITVNNILFSNKDAAKRISGATSADDFFTEMEKSATINPKQFSKVEEIGIDDFISNVLPTAHSIEAYFDGRLTGNLVSLIAPVNRDSKSMFKWDNAFSWAYTGNVTDIQIKERVKAEGGKVDGVLRFSIQWNDGDTWNRNDEDAHCIEPNGNEIYFQYQKSRITGGNLDVDIRNPRENVPAVENIAWPDIKRMLTGKYKFFVHTYAYRGGKGGFRAEIECNGGEIHHFDYQQDTRQNLKTSVADVILDSDGNFTVMPLLPDKGSVVSKEIWGIHTNQFVPVTVMMYSPNYWDEQKGKGNKHYMFMLSGCVNDENSNGYYNEFLKPELEKHRKVFEALGSKAHVIDTPDQLSGLGFSSTKRAELVVKVKGVTERLLKIKF